MTVTEVAAPAGIPLVARRKLKHPGGLAQPGDTFYVLDPGRAAVLVRGNYAAAVEADAVATVEQQTAIETSSRARMAAKPPPPVSLRDQPESRPEGPEPTLLQVADAKGTVPHPGVRVAFDVAEARIAELEGRVAELVAAAGGPAEPVKRKPSRVPPARGVAVPVPVIDIDDVVLDEEASDG